MLSMIYDRTATLIWVTFQKSLGTTGLNVQAS